LHITIQNKVSPKEAKVLQRQLSDALEPRTFAFAGLGLHLYCDTQWDSVGCWSFRGKQGG
jgi:hypothetical protein